MLCRTGSGSDNEEERNEMIRQMVYDAILDPEEEMDVMRRIRAMLNSQ